MSDIDKRAASAMAEANTRDEVLYWHKVAARQKALASRAKVTHRTRSCPGCGHALKIRVINDDTTLFACASCGWTKQFNYAMNEGRALGERYTPGVTGRPSPTMTVEMGMDGKIKRVRNI